jgi:hypothetical protein
MRNMEKRETEEKGDGRLYPGMSSSKRMAKDTTKFLSTIRIVLVLSALFIFLLFAASPAYGQVHMRSTCYNSEVTVTEDLRTENADYSGITVLLPYSGYGGHPYSIITGGTGKSIEEEFSEFSHSIFATMDGNHEKVRASLKIKSGEYEWEHEVKALSEGLDMKMSAKCEIDNGNLEAGYGNTESAVREEVSTTNSKYSSNTDITTRSITSNGVSESQNEDTCGFSSKTEVENIGKTATIEASLKEESPASEAVDHKWTKSIILLPESSSMEELMIIKSKEGWMMVPIMVPGYSSSSISARMKFGTYDLKSGEPLFPTRYVPQDGEPLYILVSRIDTGPLDISQHIDLAMSAAWGPWGGDVTP